MVIPSPVTGEQTEARAGCPSPVSEVGATETGHKVHPGMWETLPDGGPQPRSCFLLQAVLTYLSWSRQKPRAPGTSRSCCLSVCVCGQRDIHFATFSRPGSPRLTFTTLETRTGSAVPWKHLSFRKPQTMSMASLTCVRKHVFGRRWSSMNLSR